MIKLTESDYSFLIRNFFWYGENEWTEVKDRKIKKFINMGWMETKETVTKSKVKSPSGKIKETKTNLVTEFRLVARVAALILAEKARRTEADRVKAETLWEEKTAGVPKAVAAMGHVAVDYYKIYGRRPSKAEVAQIEKELAGSY